MRKSRTQHIIRLLLAFAVVLTVSAGLRPAAALGGEVGSITGRVTDSISGDPVAGVQITDPDSAAVIGVTDDAGVYTLALEPATYHLMARAAHYETGYYFGAGGTSPADIVVGSGESVTGVDLVIRPFATISGGVVGADNHAAVAGVVVKLFPMDLGVTNPVASATTDGNGAYQIQDVPAGEYTLNFDASQTSYLSRWWPQAAERSSAETIALAWGARENAKNGVLVRGGTISGRAVDSDGNALTNVPVRARTVQSADTSAAAITDEAGGYRLTGLVAGEYELEFASDGTHVGRYYGQSGPSDQPQPISVPGAEDVVAQDMVLPLGGVITGHIDAPAGSDRWLYACVGENNCADADATGNYAIKALESGEYTVSFGGYVDGRKLADLASATPVVVQLGGEQAGVNATLAFSSEPPAGATARLRGRLVDDLGQPLDGVYVSARGEVVSGSTGYFASALTDSTGSFDVPVVPASYSLRFSEATERHRVPFGASYVNGKRTAVLASAAKPGDIGTFTITRPVTVTGRIIARETGAGVESGTVSIVPVGEYAGTEDNFYSSAATSTAWTDATGGYQFTDLPAGIYTVRAAGAQGHSPRWYTDAPNQSYADNFVVTPGSTKAGVDIALSRTGTISGTVHDRYGHPLSGISVRGQRSDADDPIETTTDSAGNYTLGALVSGGYTLRFTSSTRYFDVWYPGVSGRDGAQVVNVEPGANLNGYDVALDLAQGVTGVVSGPDGPIPFVQISDMTSNTSAGYTDEAGRYTYFPPAAGARELLFRASGYAQQNVSVTLGTSADDPIVRNVDLAPQTLISGRVSLPANVAPEYRHIEIAATRTGDGKSFTDWAYCDQGQCAYSVEVQPGSYIISARDVLLAETWYPDAAQAAGAQVLTVGLGEKLRGVDFDARPAQSLGSITVNLLQDMKPIETGGEVTLVSTDGQTVVSRWLPYGVPTSAITLAAPAGEYLVECNSNDESHWYPNVRNYFDATAVTVTGGATTSVAIQWVTPPPPPPNGEDPGPDYSITYSVTGHLAADEISEDADLTVALSNQWYSNQVGVDPSGAFNLSGLPQGSYQLVVADSSGIYQTESYAVSIPASEPLSIPLNRGPSGTVRGFVHSAAQVGVGASVQVVDAAGVTRTTWTYDGTFAVFGLADGVAKIEVSPDSPYLKKTAYVAVSGAQTPLLRVPVDLGGSVAVRASLEGGVEGQFTVTAVDSTGRVVGTEGSVGPDLVSASVVVDPMTLTIRDLPEGDVWIRAAAPGRQPVWWPSASSQSGATPIHVTPGKTAGPLSLTVPLSLGDSGNVSGLVTLKGHPVAGAQIEGWDPSSGFSVSARTDAQGHYVVSAAPGSYRISAMVCLSEILSSGCERRYFPGGEGYDDAQVVKVAAGASVTGIDIDIAAIPDPIAFTSAPAPSLPAAVAVGDELAVTPRWTPSGANFTYQWRRDDQDIEGATEASYPVTTADLGARLSVQIVGRLAGYVATTVTSATTAVVAPGTMTGSVSISGDPVAGGQLTAHTTGWPEDTLFSYAWTVDGVGSAASGDTLTLTPADLGKPVAVTVTGAAFGWKSHVATATFAAGPAKLANLTPPAVGGVAKTGSTLTATPGTWSSDQATFAYQWLRDEVAIGGATGASYTLVGADFGHLISVRVTATQAEQTASASSTAVAATAGSFTATPAPTVTGTLAAGKVLTASTGTWAPGTPTFSYQWLRSGAEIAGATASTYTLTSADEGMAMAVRVTGALLGYDTATTTSVPTVPVSRTLTATPVPTLSGSARVGSVLTATPGVWGPGNVSLAYQWYRSGTPIAGATATTYALTPADYQAVITVSVTGSQAGYLSVTKLSAPTPAVAAATLSATPVPTISGTTRVGSMLSASAGGWAPAPVTLSYQWARSGVAITGATSAAYALTAADLGKTITVTVTGSKPGYATVAKVSAATGVVALGTLVPTPAPTVSGTPKVGYRLTAVPGTWGPAPVTLAYQWLRSGTAISGATASTYLLTAADLGKSMAVRVTGSRAGFATVAKTSAGTAAVAVGTLTAVTPTVSGTPKVGYRLTAVPGTWGPAPVTLAYQWLRSGTAISGATASTYLLTAADLGKSITVRVTGTKAGFSTLAKVSAATAGVAAGTLTAVTPTVSGTPKVGYRLTAVPGTWGPAPVTLAYQWLRSGTAISGATASTYLLTAADLGKSITVRVTGTKAGFSTLAKVSAATAGVAAGTLTAVTPTVSGTPKVGYRLTAVPGTWGPAPVTLAYQWLRSGTAISGATASTYLLTALDKGKSITVRVTGTKAGYTTTPKTSAGTALVA